MGEGNSSSTCIKSTAGRVFELDRIKVKRERKIRPLVQDGFERSPAARVAMILIWTFTTPFMCDIVSARLLEKWETYWLRRSGPLPFTCVAKTSCVGPAACPSPEAVAFAAARSTT